MTDETQAQKPEENTKADTGVDNGRYSIQVDGQVFWQENSTNPLPGKAVGTIEKGETPLFPKVSVTGDKSKDELQAAVDAHIGTILAPLFALKDTDGENALTEAAKDIGDVVFDNMGVVHRGDIEKFVPALTPELRGPIRRKRLKMGPVLVFLFDLMKPAAVNMRALLWAVWNEKTLPMETPADGRVSITIDTESVDRNFYRSIGYPVFGNKAIRIDMLDRVITDVYDSAKEWKFQAKHQYAEWLGCNIEDLYGVLSSMGHIQIKEEVKAEVVEKQAEPVEIEKETAVAETKTSETDETPKTDVKPELAFFKLKKGKISDRPKPKFTAEKKDFKPRPKKKPVKSKPQGAKTFSAKPKANEVDENNPFAILSQLKTK